MGHLQRWCFVHVVSPFMLGWLSADTLRERMKRKPKKKSAPEGTLLALTRYVQRGTQEILGTRPCQAQAQVRPQAQAQERRAM